MLAWPHAVHGPASARAPRTHGMESTAARARRGLVRRRIGVETSGPDDPVATGGQRFGSFTAVLRGYEIERSDVDHAPRMLRGLCHGFATLQSGGGFQWSADIDESSDWLIAFADEGLLYAPRLKQTRTSRVTGSGL
ncbi:WHG domain-containing protein [Streptomyces sp. KK5PA1]|uniref:WHG domain-containing protein n=1 Tax=Actinacidiphila acididurans TaxID=2784346 RepID=A0ABS2TIK8_9ACTN|nr:WHG domain-containing protein [Actinacidiphila acididurans]